MERPEPKFNVGETVVVLYSINSPEMAGREIEIAARGFCLLYGTDKHMWFYVEPGNESSLIVPGAPAWSEDQLRKLPPKDTPSTWAQGIWQPKEVTA